MGAGEAPAVAELLATQLAAFLALLLATTAAHKGWRFAHARSVAHEFAGVPRAAAPAAVLFASLLEAGAAVLLIVPSGRASGAWISTLVLSGYLALIVRAIAKGRRDVDCGCSFAPSRHPLGAFHIVRNAALALASLAVAITTRSGGAGAAQRARGSVRALGAVWRTRSSDEPVTASQERCVMSLVIASEVALWIAVLVLSVVCIALARQVGVLHQRLAPAGALALSQPLKLGEAAPEMNLIALDGSAVKIGGVRGGRSQMLLFISPECTVCEALLPAVRSAQSAERRWLEIVLASDGDREIHARFVADKGLAKFPYVLSEHLGRSYAVAKLPYAVLIDEVGRLSATGLVNTREHLESLFVAKERGVGSIQQFLRTSDRRASSGE